MNFLMDIRWWQILILSSLNLLLIIIHRHNLGLLEVISVIGMACLIEGILQKYILKKFDLKSAAITSLSLCLLVKTNSLLIYFLLAFIALASKYLIRINNKHIFNPTNLALVVVLLFPSLGWVSPGQFQNEWISFVFVFFMGLYIVRKCVSLDMALYFFGIYIAAQFIWFGYTGDPLTILFHRLSQVGLIIFGFLMITDPRTIPNASKGRFFFALSVVIIYFIFNHYLYIKNGLFYGLAITSLATPILDILYKAERFQWKKQSITLGY